MAWQVAMSGRSLRRYIKCLFYDFIILINLLKLKLKKFKINIAVCSLQFTNNHNK